jgi:hypothetical protein
MKPRPNVDAAIEQRVDELLAEAPETTAQQREQAVRLLARKDGHHAGPGEFCTIIGCTICP